MEISLEAMRRFFRERSADLRRVMYGAKGDVELCDVESEAYVIATEIQTRRGQVFDFDNPQDQDSLLGGLWNRLVKFAERNFRNAVTIDDEGDDDAPSFGATIARTLAAGATADPAILIQQEQEAEAAEARAFQSYSQAVAYVILLRRFDEDKARLANHLRVALYTLLERIRHATAVVQVQPSVFDGVERIPHDFIPTVNRLYVSIPRQQLVGEQWTWDF